MRLLFWLIGFSICCNYLCAQQSVGLDKRLVNWRLQLSRGAWQAVADSCDHALQQPKKSLSRVEITNVITLKATALRQGGHPDDALRLHRQALRLRRAARGAWHEDVAFSYLNIGNCCLELGRTQEAHDVLTKCKNILQRCFHLLDTNLVPVFTSLGEWHRRQRQYGQAERYWRKALAISSLHFPAHSQPVTNARIHLASLWSEQFRFDSALVMLQAARRDKELSGDTLDADQVRILNNLATALARLGWHGRAVATWQKAIQLGDTAPGVPQWLRGDCRYNLGLAQLETGDLSAAEINLRAALSFFPDDPFTRAQVWNGLGLAARYRNDVENAAACFTEALNSSLEYGPDAAPRYETAGIYRNLGVSCLQLDMTEPALFYTQKALTMFTSAANAPAEEAACLHALAQVFLKKNDYTAAAVFQEKALRKTPPEQTALVAVILQQKGERFFLQKQYAKALAWYHRAFERLETAAPAAFLSEKIQVLAALAKCRKALAVNGENPDDWRAVLRHSGAATALLDELKGSFRGDASLLEMQESCSMVFDLAVEASLQLGDKAGAWRWAEAFKSNAQQRLAWQALRQSAQSSAPELFVAEQNARRRLVYFQQMRYEQTKNDDPALPGLSLLTTELDDSIRLWSETCAVLRERITRQHPGLYQHLFRQPQPDVSTLRQHLSPGKTLLEYHWGAENLTLFLIRHDTFLVFSLSGGDTLAASIARFFALCQTAPSWQGEAEYAELVRLGSALYQGLLGQAAAWLTEELIIVPDGLLCYLPFEALIQKAGAMPHRFRSHHYLLQTHSIGYCHTAGIFLQLSQQRVPTSLPNVLAVAPVFAANNLGLKALRYNAKEVEAIHAFWNSTLMTGVEANEKRFLKEASQHRIFLLSTHGLVDNRQPEFSFVALSQPAAADSIEDNLLYVAEIYGAQLPADLVMLSACETAGGKLYRGEGLISIARAFQTAGARTVVTSLWNVDDQQTPMLTAGFFRCLKAGQGKFESLARARRDYLAQAAGVKSHPYYWAGFVAIGDDGAVVAPGSSWIWLVVVFSLMVAAGIFWMFRKQTLQSP